MQLEPTIRDELMTLLRYANKSAIAKELHVTPQAVINWSEGRNVSLGRLEQVRALFGLNEKTPAPVETGTGEWAQMIATEAARAVIEELLPSEWRRALQLLIERLDEPPPPSSEDVPEGGARSGQDEQERRVQADERRPGLAESR